MSEIKLEGSCLCGSVEYQLESDASNDAPRFYYCYCQRCRKASGTGHSSIIILTHSTLKWKKGESCLGRYKVPEAERFSTCFCRNCGSPLPRFDSTTGRAVVPAGSLDHGPTIKPEAKIFWDSRVQWSCEENLPVYSEYPE